MPGLAPGIVVVVACRLRGSRTQNIENNPMQSSWRSLAYAIPRKHFDTSGKSPAIFHHRAISRLEDGVGAGSGHDN